jgi:hypothetical protein
MAPVSFGIACSATLRRGKDTPIVTAIQQRARSRIVKQSLGRSRENDIGPSIAAFCCVKRRRGTPYASNRLGATSRPCQWSGSAGSSATLSSVRKMIRLVALDPA